MARVPEIQPPLHALARVRILMCGMKDEIARYSFYKYKVEARSACISIIGSNIPPALLTQIYSRGRHYNMLLLDSYLLSTCSLVFL